MAETSHSTLPNNYRLITNSTKEEYCIPTTTTQPATRRTTMNTGTVKRKRSPATTDIFVLHDSVSGGRRSLSSLSPAGTVDFSVVVENDNNDEGHRCGCRHEEYCHHCLHLPTYNTKDEEKFTHRRRRPRHHHHPSRRRHHPNKTNFSMNFLFVTVITTLTSMLAIFPLSSSYSLSGTYHYEPSSIMTSSSSSGRRNNEGIIVDKTNNSPEGYDHLPLVTKPRRQRRRNLQVVDVSTTTVKEMKTTETKTSTTAESTTTKTKKKKDGKLTSQDPESNTEEVCEPVEGTCQQCTFSEQKSYEACVPTGRWMKYQCTTSTATSSSSDGGGKDDGDGEDQDSPKTRIEMRSCHYTQSDEEFAMVRLQVICVLLGVLAIMSVKKNKRVSASLFDQRKLGMQPGNNKQSTMGSSINGGSRSSDKKLRNSSYSSENDEEIEFTPMTNQQQQQQRQQQLEMAPLVGLGSGSSHGLMSVGSYDELEVI